MHRRAAPTRCRQQPNSTTTTKVGYQFNLPNFVSVSEAVLGYAEFSFIAELGGWSGLLTGVSVLGLWMNLFGFILNFILDKVSFEDF